MSWTASPGIRRGSVNTITDAMISDGMATSSRRARYRFSTDSAVEPGGRQPPSVVVAEIGSVVLEGAVPDGRIGLRDRGDVVHLLGQVALDLVNELAPLGDVERPALPDDHVGHDRIVDVALVLQLAGEVMAEDEVVGIEERRLWSERHGVELPVEARRDVGAVLLGVE